MIDSLAHFAGSLVNKLTFSTSYHTSFHRSTAPGSLRRLSSLLVLSLIGVAVGFSIQRLGLELNKLEFLKKFSLQKMNHDDLLNADLPTTESRRTELLDAVKNRAKGAFQTRDLPSAEKLYGRAITICERRIDGERLTEGLHLLYSNRAAVRLLLSKFDSALADCESSLDLDASFIKSHFRKSQALIGLKKFGDAVSACDQALVMYEGNKELLDLKNQAEKKQAEEAAKPAELAPKDDVYRPVRPNKESGADSSPKKKAKSSGDKDEDKDDSEALKMRGYKKTADGKTTSYFHTELDDAAKKLMGDCKPQKLEGPVDTGKTVSGSAWNQAGTFEEKNVTSWFADLLKAEVKGSLLIGKNQDIKVKYHTTKTNGDASITCARGKVKYVHDMSVTLSWKFASTKGDKGLEDGPSVKGTVTFEADGDGDWDVTTEVDAEKGPQNPDDRSIVQDYIKKEVRGLQPEVLRKLKKCEGMFREKGL